MLWQSMLRSYTDPVTSLTDTEFTSFTDSATAVELDVDDMNTAQPVGKLYTYSNRRVYRVEITATPLSSAAGGSTNYIDYTVSGGKNVDLDDTTYSTHGAETANPASVFYAKSAASAGAEMGANGQLISVKIDTDYSTVAAGGYNGAITFNYIAE